MKCGLVVAIILAAVSCKTDISSTGIFFLDCSLEGPKVFEECTDRIIEICEGEGHIIRLQSGQGDKTVAQCSTYKEKK